MTDRLPPEATDVEVIAEVREIDAILLSLNGDFAELIPYPPDQSGKIAPL